MPATPPKVFDQLGIDDLGLKGWNSIDFGAAIQGIKVRRKDPIFPRIDRKIALKVEEKQEPKKETKKDTPKERVEEGANLISFDDFFKTELKVAEIIAAEKVEKTDKLLKLSLQVGEEKRIIVAGIALHYTAEELLGKKIIIVANLKPAKLRGIESQGMLLAATAPDKKKMTLLTVDSDVPSGSKVG
jgi:methionyl-tRNA synthetase